MKNNKKILIIIGFCLLIIACVSVSYALLVGFDITGGENKINTGSITFTYSEQSNELNIVSNEIINDDDGKLLNDYFSFNIASKASGNIDVGYYIYFTPVAVEKEQLNMSAIKLYLSSVQNENDAINTETEVVVPTLLSNLIPFTFEANGNNARYDATSNNYLIYSTSFNFNNNETTQTHYYRLRLWLDSGYTFSTNVVNENNEHTVTIEEKEYKLKVNVLGIDGKPNTITKA